MEILIADDHALFREGMQYLLRQLDDGLVLHETENSTDVLQIARENTQLDLVLLDISLKGGSGLETLPALRETAPGVPVVIISANEDVGVIRQAMEQGAQGYIPKSSSGKTMLAALQFVLSGGVYLPPLLLDQDTPKPESQGAVADGSSANTQPAGHDLTLRQLEVLSLMAKGLSNRKISTSLNVTEGTVKLHVTAILKSLDVTNRTQAVLVAQEMGLAAAGNSAAV